jgi:TetR/AcrR family transcriptional regulator, mexCD-oprJ operon repressor
MTRDASPARRADARRSITRILDAAVRLLSQEPMTSVAEIAQAAGVGRVTLYGHFPSRAALVEAAFAHAIYQGEHELEVLDLSGYPPAALQRLIHSSWRLIVQSRNLLVAAQDALPPGRIRALHARPAQRLEALIQRGQAERAFRTDLPAAWLVEVLYSLMKGAADEINAGRLKERHAPRLISATVLAAFNPPGQRTPAV